MRIPLSAVSLVLVCATPATAAEMPARKPGLWEMKMSFDGRNIPPQTMQQCVDAATDKRMQEMGGNMRAQSCSKRDVQQVGNTIVFDSVCDMGGGTVTSHGVASGDFNSAYTVKVSSKRAGGPPVPNMPAETNMTIEAKYAGPCKSDQKPGDVIMSNGMKMNMRDMPPGGPGGPPAMRK